MHIQLNVNTNKKT